jgi:hypothetical protein
MDCLWPIHLRKSKARAERRPLECARLDLILDMVCIGPLLSEYGRPRIDFSWVEELWTF